MRVVYRGEDGDRKRVAVIEINEWAIVLVLFVSIIVFVFFV